jgi:hypothetical protein
MFLTGKADIMDDRLSKLTHEDSHGFLKDLFERLASHRGRLWLQAIKRFLLGTSTEFYMLEIGNTGSIRNLLEQFSHAGFSVSPVGGKADGLLRKSHPKQCSGSRECFRMLPVRAMDFDRTRAVKHATLASAIAHIGLMEGCKAMSWEAACNLLLETEKTDDHASYRRKSLLELAPTPIVWTFVAGNHDNRTSFATGVESEKPSLVGLVSPDANLGFRGIAEAEYLWTRLGREPNTILPGDVFVFSIDTDRI